MNQNHPKHRSPSAFTIIEMIIVITIMAILGTIGTRTYFAERDRFEFNNALIKTMQLVKSVRTYATTSYPIYIDREGFKQNIIPLNGYGIKAEFFKASDKLTLTIFANVDTGGNGAGIERFQNDDDPLKLDGNDIILETYTLPKQITFRYFYFDNDKKWVVDNVQPENTGPTAFVAYMIFKPPLGEMAIADPASPTPLNELGLQFENLATDASGQKKCQRIIINKVKEFPELKYEPGC